MIAARSATTTPVLTTTRSSRGACAIARANGAERACAAALAMTIATTPLAATAAVEVAQVAKGDKVDSKALAGDLFAEQQAKSKPAAPKKTKQVLKAPSMPTLSAPSMPTLSAPKLSAPKLPSAPKLSAPSLPSAPKLSAPSLSLPKLGGGGKKEAPAPKKKKSKASKASSGGGSNLPLVLLVLFSPLAVVQGFTFSTMARLAKQAADK